MSTARRIRRAAKAEVTAQPDPTPTPQSPPLSVPLTDTQRVAMRSTMELKTIAQQRVAQYEKQLSDVCKEVVTAAGHSMDTVNWRLSPDGKALVGEPIQRVVK